MTTVVPGALFGDSMAGAAGVIGSAATFKKLGTDYGNSKGGVNCTGPFELKSWQSGEKLSLKRFDEYWDTDLKAKAKELDFVIMTDPVARANAMRSGEVDGGWIVPSNAVGELKASGAGDVFFGLSTAVNSLVVSSLGGPLGKPEVRKALMMAIDLDALV